MRQVVFIFLVFFLTSEAKALKVSVLPFSCEHPRCESSSGNGMAKALSNALRARGIEIVERWGGPDYIIQGEIKDFDLESPDALVSIEVRVIDAKAGKLIKILNADGHSYETTGGVSLPSEFLKWRGKPGENAIISAVTNITEKILSAIGEKKSVIQTIPERIQPTLEMPSEQIKGGSRFVPGENLLFFSNLSKYEIGDVPVEFKIDGQVEIAEFKGKKWIRALSHKGIISIPFKFPGNWSLETSYYWTLKEFWSWLKFGIRTGNSRKFLEIEVTGRQDYEHKMKWKGVELKGRSFPSLSQVHTIAFSKRNEVLRVFVDGVMVVNEREEDVGIRGSEIKAEEEFFVEFEYINPAEGNEFLLGDIRVAGYK